MKVRGPWGIYYAICKDTCIVYGEKSLKEIHVH